MSFLVGLKIRIAAMLSHPAIGKVVGSLFRDRIPMNGCVIDTAGDEIPPALKAMILFRIYESAEIRFIHRYLRSDLDVVELGGCIGVVSSHIARRLAPGKRLLTIEPNPALLDHIRRNVERNAPGALFRVVHAAIDYTADGRDETTLLLGRAHIDSSVGAPDPMRASTVVPATTLCRVLEEHAVGDYALVCDIEGSEAGLLARDTRSLARCKQVIVELHPTRFEGRSVSVDDMVEGLRTIGFRVVDAHGPVHVLEH